MMPVNVILLGWWYAVLLLVVRVTTPCAFNVKNTHLQRYRCTANGLHDIYPYLGYGISHVGYASYLGGTMAGLTSISRQHGWCHVGCTGRGPTSPSIYTLYLCGVRWRVSDNIHIHACVVYPVTFDSCQIWTATRVTSFFLS